MIRTSYHTHCRAAALVAAAVLTLTSTQRAAAQQTVDLLGGTLTATPTLSVTTTGVNTATSNNGSFGPTGYSGTVTVGANAVETFSEGFATLGSSNSYTIGQTTPGLLSAASTAVATKTFTGISLSPGATYSLTLSRASGFTVGLLGRTDITLTEGATTVLNTANGIGLLGAADVLALFGTNNTETLQFTVPAGATGNLVATFNTTLPGTVLSGSYTFTGASVTQVPEPTTVGAMMIGVAGLALLRARHRLRVAL